MADKKIMTPEEKALLQARHRQEEAEARNRKKERECQNTPISPGRSHFGKYCSPY